MICFELLSSLNLYKLLCLTKGSCFFTLYCKNGVPMIKDMKIGLQVRSSPRHFSKWRCCASSQTVTARPWGQVTMERTELTDPARGIAWSQTCNTSVRIYSGFLSWSPSLLSFRSLIGLPLTLLLFITLIVAVSHGLGTCAVLSPIGLALEIQALL